MFTSDNGPAYQGSPGPFKGGKTDLHEGGIRVPGFFVWNGHIKSGTHTFQTVHFADFLPTVCEINNIDISHNQIDGRSLLPVLKGEDNIEERILLWQMDMYAHFQNQGAKPKPYSTAVAVKGNWKMLADSLTPVELFNMVQDHREIYNLLGMKNELEKELSSHIENFFAEPRLECCE
jgi:arylsulfatase A-like enzyme